MIEISESAIKPHACLVAAFTGIGGRLGAIPYEFHRTLVGADCAALYIRDLGRRWYQYGPHDGDSEPTRVAERIIAAKAKCGAARLVLLGNSMGGYGALMFASLMSEVDAVLAFSPQTVILPDVVRTMRDKRWMELWQGIKTFPYGDLAEMDDPKADVTLVYDNTNRLDQAHICRLTQAWPRCGIVAASGGHAVASVLRDRGELTPLIARTIAGRREGRNG